MKYRGQNLAVLAALASLALGCARADEEESGTAAADTGMTESVISADSLRVTRERRPEPGTRALVEFAREIRDEDLEWLRRNGFEVDTVFGRTVRGLLRDPQGGEVIAEDPRVVALEALMR